MKKRRVFTSVTFALAAAFACGGTTAGTSSAQWAACSANSECTIAAKTCCGVCGKPALEDVDGVNQDQLEAHKQAVCPTPVACSACPTQSNPDLFATCAEATCKAVDVRSDPSSECSADDDCRLRVTACCECGGSTASFDLIALNRSKEAIYTKQVCDPMQACDLCLPVYPRDVEAHCAADGHCEVRPATPRTCDLPFDAGPCDAAIRVFAFVDGVCVERIYGGCDGNGNRFATAEECIAACQKVGP